MKKNLAIATLFLALTVISMSAGGQEIFIQQSDITGIYKKREKISVIALVPENKVDSLQVKVSKNNYTELPDTLLKFEGEGVLLFQGAFHEPCAVMIEAGIKEHNSAIGFVVAPHKIKPGGDRPADFDDFWKQEKAKLKALPFDVKTAEVNDYDIEPGYSCVNMEINCTGPKPARGYFARPVIAAPKSMPIVLLVHAAGVKGSWCRSEPGNAMKYARLGTLCFDLNAHGMLNGQPDDYYAELEKGELKDYYFQGMNSRDDFYFKGMYLRLMRTLDYLTNQPEWDRKRILVIGESQGGGQALVAAGLDKRVSAVVAIVPAMCDWLGPLADREGGWPHPLQADFPREEILNTVPYFDAANILKGSKATIFVEIGLIDITCPPASVYAAINQSRGKKIIYAVPYREHHQPQNNFTKLWEEKIYYPRENFIRNYLK